MQPGLSWRSEERTNWTIEATRVMALHSHEIAEACLYAPEDSTVLAVILPDQGYGDARAVPLSQLRESVAVLPLGSWHYLFSPGTTAGEVEQHLKDMEQLLTLKLAALRRYLSKQQGGTS